MTARRAAHVGFSGILSSRIMIVMRIAITPSLKASSRPLCMAVSRNDNRGGSTGAPAMPDAQPTPDTGALAAAVCVGALIVAASPLAGQFRAVLRTEFPQRFALVMGLAVGGALGAAFLSALWR